VAARGAGAAGRNAGLPFRIIRGCGQDHARGALAFLQESETQPGRTEAPTARSPVAGTVELVKPLHAQWPSSDEPRSRLCRWLLQSQDMIGSDTFSLTQEFLSHMLGVRRNTVSVEAHAVQEAGLIRYRRGQITILNRDGLEDCACECYSVIRAETDKLMGAANSQSEPGA
jgi:Crp-like helix-turn-helix domain